MSASSATLNLIKQENLLRLSSIEFLDKTNSANGSHNNEKTSLPLIEYAQIQGAVF